MVLALGMTLLAAGVILSPAFLIVGFVVLASGLGMWISHLLPGEGHMHEAFVAPGQHPEPVAAHPGTVEQLREGMPGYRMRLPLAVRPISAGIKGGIAGGLVMPVPALIWGLVRGFGIWYPVNLLAGMVLPGVDAMSIDELQQFHLSLLLVGIVIHAVMTLVVGLIYGVLLPTLPEVSRAASWGGLLMPLLWTAVSYPVMRIVNPALASGVAWPWFIASQFVFGIVAAAVVLRLQHLTTITAGLLGGPRAAW